MKVKLHKTTMKGSGKIEFSNNVKCSCFVMISWPLRSVGSGLKALGIETEKGERHYLSVASSSFSPSGRESSAAHVIKINGRFGSTLKLKDGEFVRFWMLEDLTSQLGNAVSSAKVSCYSEDDWEILESNAEFVSNHLLDQLRVVYPGLEFPFWLSQSMVIRLKIDEINPHITECGVLTSNSEIIVPSITSKNIIPSALKKHLKLRVHPLSIPDISLNPGEALLFSNEHHGFMFRAHLNQNKEVGIPSPTSIPVKIILNGETDKESAQEILLRMFFIESVLESNSPMKAVLPLTNISCIYLHHELIKRFKIPLKTWVWCSILSEEAAQELPNRTSSLVRSTDEEPLNQHCGFEDTLQECVNFIKASLSLSPHPAIKHNFTGPEFGSLLIQGKPGSGKSLLTKKIVQRLSGSPYFVHWEFINCAKLKGKKPENMEKEIVKSLRELEDRQPSVLVLDDFDVLFTTPKVTGEQSHQEEFLQFKTCETLLETLMKRKQFNNKLAVICSVSNKESLDAHWKSRSGFHFIQKTMKIPTPGKAERLQIFMACLNRYLENTGSNGISCVKRSHLYYTKTEAPSGRSEENNAIENVEDELTKRIGVGLGSIHEQNATPQFLVNVAKKWGAYLQSLDIPTSYREHELEQNVPTERGHVSSSAALRINNMRSNEDVNEQMKIFNQMLQEEIRFSGDLNDLKKKGKHQQELKITWDSVGGIASIKQELRKILEWPIKFPQFFKNTPIRLPCGVLFYGYPGTGKSLLGHAIQTMVNVKFIHVKGPELLSKYIGASEQAVQDVFARARESRPCILFFDEFDSLVPRRGHDSSGVTDRVVNQFLSEMDGVDGGLGEGVYLIAATSRPDLIDPAVLRPGRLDKHFFFDLPSKSERKEIMKAITSQEGTSTSLQLMDESYWDEICELTQGFTGADLNSLLFSAQLSLVHEYLGQHSSLLEAKAAVPDPNAQEEIKVGKESILCALKDFKPSLHGEELKKFRAIYQDFSSSKRSGAKELSSMAGTKLEEDDSSRGWRIEPGKRATLA